MSGSTARHSSTCFSASACGSKGQRNQALLSSNFRSFAFCQVFCQVFVKVYSEVYSDVHFESATVGVLLCTALRCSFLERLAGPLLKTEFHLHERKNR